MVRMEPKASHLTQLQRHSGVSHTLVGVDQTAQALRALAEPARGGQRPAALGELEITIKPPGPPDLDAARQHADLGVHRIIIELEGIDDAAVDSLIASIGDTLAGHV
jgi:hypothetical protein